MSEQKPHMCDCGNPATHCYREGRGTGHSEHICRCEECRDEVRLCDCDPDDRSLHG